MSNNFNIRLPNGYCISCENEDPIDITDDAGENVMEAQEDQQKPVDDEFAEYDAAEESDEGNEVEDVQEVAKANESTFFGLAMAKRAQEGFGISSKFKKMTFSSAKQAVNSSEVKAAITEAKNWAAKKGYKLAKSGGTISTGGASIGVKAGKKFTTLTIYFEQKNGKIISKKLATYTNKKGKTSSESYFNNYFSFEDGEDPIVESGEADDNPITTVDVENASETETVNSEENDAETTDVDVEEEVEADNSEEITSEGTSSGEADSEEKAIESFFASWGI